MYDVNSADSIIEFAKILKGKTLRTACNVDFDEFKINDKGGYGKTAEKYYFNYQKKQIMTYTMVKKTSFMFPTERYLNVIKKGYKDCNLDEKYLKKALSI